MITKMCANIFTLDPSKYSAVRKNEIIEILASNEPHYRRQNTNPD